MAIQIVDGAGKVVQQTKTSYDGYWVISKVRPGRYTLRVEGAPPRELVVRPDQPLLAGRDVRLGGPRPSRSSPPWATLRPYAPQSAATAARTNLARRGFPGIIRPRSRAGAAG